MRRGEILALRWRDVDLLNGMIRVQRSLEQTNAGVRFKEPETKKSRSPISMPRFLVDALEWHRTQQIQHQKTLGAGYEDNDLICCYEDAGFGLPNRFRACISISCAASESESDFTTFGTAMLLNCCALA
jgi:hypothetical protein